jgi:hypothetical protein
MGTASVALVRPDCNIHKRSHAIQTDEITHAHHSTCIHSVTQNIQLSCLLLAGIGAEESKDTAGLAGAGDTACGTIIIGLALAGDENTKLCALASVGGAREDTETDATAGDTDCREEGNGDLAWEREFMGLKPIPPPGDLRLLLPGENKLLPLLDFCISVSK